MALGLSFLCLTSAGLFQDSEAPNADVKVGGATTGTRPEPLTAWREADETDTSDEEVMIKCFNHLFSP